MNKTRFLFACSALALAAAGCNNPPAATPDAGRDAGGGTDTGTTDSGGGTDSGMEPDTGGGGNDAGMVTNDCAGYCSIVMANCSGTNAQYADAADCMAQCTDLAFPAGTPGATDGNSIACRIYHAGVAGGAGMATAHCPHAGPTGGGVCGTNTLRTDPTVESTSSSGYIRVDRMGMPAVATALIGPAIGPGGAILAGDPAAKDTYNDGSPMDDAAFTYAPGQLNVLATFHAVLDEQLISSGLHPCPMATTAPGAPYFPTGIPIPMCASQPIDGASAPPVATLIVPDTLRLDPSVDAGFPNGRRLADPVIDVTLGVLLLNTRPCAPHFSCLNHTDAASCTTAGVAEHCAWTPTGATTGVCLSDIAAMCEAHAGTTADACALTAGCEASTCGSGRCTAASLAGMALNPPANDVAFGTTFPYLAPPHTP